MTSATNPNANQLPQSSLYDPTNHQTVAWQADPTTINTDNSVTPPITYGKAATTGGGGGGGGAVTDVVQTGTISADQGAVTASFGAGVASWSVDARGTFSAGTTLIFEYELDAGLDYNPAFGVPIGSTSDVAVSSVAGGAAISYQGNAAGFQKFRVRAHPFQGGDSVAITIIGSVATDGGFVSKSLPPGSNVIGKVGIQVSGADVSQSNAVPVNMQHGNVVDTGNSSTSTLTANSIFTGTSQSSLNYSAIAIEAFADQVSAANGLQVLQSQDNVNFDLTDSFSVSASTAFTTVVNLVGQFYKIKYTNGGTGQGTFRLQTIKQAAESVLPRTLTAFGNFKTALQEALPAGSNLIGGVNIQQIGGVAAQMSNSDGVNPANIPAEALYIYDSGGPVDSTGKPQQLAFARAKTWLGSATNTGTITATVQGDTNLVFSVAPKTIMPGQKIRLTGATTEYAIVSSTYVPSSTATSVSCAAALVQAGNTTATWDVFSSVGAGTNAILPDGLLPGGIPLIYDPATGNIYAANAGSADGVNPRYLPEFVPGLYNGSTADRWQGKNGAGYIARNAQTVLNQASTAQTANGNSADLSIGPYTEIAIDINVTANSGTNQTLQLFWDRKGVDGNYYAIWQSAQITTTNQALSTSIGAGMAYTQSLGTTGRLRWVIGGTTPSYTFSASVIGK